MDPSNLPHGIFLKIENRRELFFMDGSGVEPENDLCIFWRRILAYEWTDARWHEELRFFAHFLHVHFNATVEKLVTYNTLFSINSYSKHTQDAVFHPFHKTKYKETINASPDGKFMRPATAGDAILRLVITATVDAIAELWQVDWGTTSWFLNGCIREGPLCETKLARKAAENENLALLFDKMCISDVVNADLMLEGVSEHECFKIKASIMECLFANLYDVEGESGKLAELLIVCMVEALIFFAIYDVEKNRSLLPYLAR